MPLPTPSFMTRFKWAMDVFPKFVGKGLKDPSASLVDTAVCVAAPVATVLKND